MNCKTCGKEIVQAEGNLSQQSAWRHADGTGAGVVLRDGSGQNVADQWCETEDGYVKVEPVSAPGDHRSAVGAAHLIGWDAPFLARHLVDEHGFEERHLGQGVTHLTTQHQSEHESDSVEVGSPTAYWLHTTFVAESHEAALKIAEAIVQAHPTSLDAQAWDISEGGDWAEIVGRVS